MIGNRSYIESGLCVSDVMSMINFHAVLDMEEIDQDFSNCPIYRAALNVGRDYFNFMSERISPKTDRRGEVIMVIENKQRRILMHTKSHYPSGIYRLPTGGVRFGETANTTFVRELWEETGFKAEESRGIALLLYEFYFAENSMPFVSYIYYQPNVSEEPEVRDPAENISDFLWSSPARIRDIAQQLMSVPDGWRDWGNMRAVSHGLVAEWLNSNRRSIRSGGT
jgi:8-oxo-dGTP diphosphatase